MFDFLSFNNNAFGLDISDLSIKAVELKKKRGGVEISAFGRKEMEAGIVVGGEIQDEEALVNILKECLGECGKRLSTKRVIASLPEERAFLQVIQIPKMNSEDLKRAVAFEAEDYIPMSRDEIYLDFEVVDLIVDSLDHLDVMIAALPKKVVDPYHRVLEKAGMDLVAFEIEPHSIARAVVKDNRFSGRMLIVDLGESRTRFIIFAGHAIRFFSSSSICGGVLDQVIADKLGISTEKAEKMKVRYGVSENAFLNDDESEPVNLKEILEPSLKDLVRQIDNFIDYYSSHASHEHLPPSENIIDKVVLCGGGARLDGIKELIEDDLNYDTEIANPVGDIRMKGVVIPPGYTSALGLALRGVNVEFYD